MVSQYNKGPLRNAYLDRRTTGNRCEMIQVTDGQETGALARHSSNFVWIFGYFQWQIKPHYLEFLVCAQIENWPPKISVPFDFPPSGIFD